MITYIKQINVDKILKHSGRRVVAGEDGFIKIIIREENTGEYKVNKKLEEKVIKSFRETMTELESMTGNDDFLASIEDVDEYSNGDILACTSDGDFGLYELQNKNSAAEGG